MNEWTPLWGLSSYVTSPFKGHCEKSDSESEAHSRCLCPVSVSLTLHETKESELAWLTLATLAASPCASHSQASPHPRTFAQAVPSTWSTLPSALYLADPYLP